MKHIPNPPELVLLKMLWLHDGLAVKDLHLQCVPDLNWSFSSTRKTIERMIEKGQVRTEPGEKATLYRARVSKAATLAHMARDFMRRVLEVNGAVPMAVFDASPILSDDDLDEIEGLL